MYTRDRRLSCRSLQKLGYVLIYTLGTKDSLAEPYEAGVYSYIYTRDTDSLVVPSKSWGRWLCTLGTKDSLVVPSESWGR